MGYLDRFSRLASAMNHQDGEYRLQYLSPASPTSAPAPASSSAPSHAERETAQSRSRISAPLTSTAPSRDTFQGPSWLEPSVTHSSWRFSHNFKGWTKSAAAAAGSPASGVADSDERLHPSDRSAISGSFGRATGSPESDSIPLVTPTPSSASAPAPAPTPTAPECTPASPDTSVPDVPAQVEQAPQSSVPASSMFLWDTEPQADHCPRPVRDRRCIIPAIIRREGLSAESLSQFRNFRVKIVATPRSIARPSASAIAAAPREEPQGTTGFESASHNDTTLADGPGCPLDPGQSAKVGRKARRKEKMKTKTKEKDKTKTKTKNRPRTDKELVPRLSNEGEAPVEALDSEVDELISSDSGRGGPPLTLRRRRAPKKKTSQRNRPKEPPVLPTRSADELVEDRLDEEEVEECLVEGRSASES